MTTAGASALGTASAPPARPGQDDDPDVAVSPSRSDPVVHAVSNIIGGPPGDHAALPARRSWWTPVRVLLLLTVIACSLGYAQKATCRDTRNWSHEYQYTRMCYSDVVALYAQEGLNRGLTPYLDYATEYPPLIGLTMEIVGSVSRLAPAQHPVYKTENGQQVIDHWSIDARSALYYDLTALVFLAFALVTVVALAKTAGQRRIWDAALFALAPTLVFHLLTNWDIIAVAFGAMAVWAWSRRAPVAAGILLGLGVTTKLYPALFLLALAALCWRSGTLRAFARTLVATVVTVIVVLAPVWLTAGYFAMRYDEAAKRNQLTKVHDGILQTMWHGDSWTGMLFGHSGDASNAVLQFFTLNKTRVADWDSIAFALQWLSGAHDPGWFGGMHLTILLISAVVLAAATYLLTRAGRREPLPVIFVAAGIWLVLAIAAPLALGAIHDNGGVISVPTLNTVTGLAMVLAVLAILALCVLAPRRPRLPQILFLLVVAFLLTNKVFSPQYTLWLLPLYALARPRWRAFLIWQLTEIYLLFMRFMHFIYNDMNGARGVARGWFIGGVAIRDVALVVLAVLVVREILHPERDLVRASGVDDPAGGVFDNAPDVRLPRLRRPAADEPDPPVAAGTGPVPTAVGTDDGPGSLFRSRRAEPEPE